MLGYSDVGNGFSHSLSAIRTHGFEAWDPSGTTIVLAHAVEQLRVLAVALSNLKTLRAIANE